MHSKTSVKHRLIQSLQFTMDMGTILKKIISIYNKSNLLCNYEMNSTNVASMSIQKLRNRFSNKVSKHSNMRNDTNKSRAGKWLSPIWLRASAMATDGLHHPLGIWILFDFWFVEGENSAGADWCMYLFIWYAENDMLFGSCLCQNWPHLAFNSF